PKVLILKMAGTTGIEPATSCVTGKHSNQLSYAPKPKLFNFQSHSGATQLANCVVKPLASAEPRQLSYAPKPKLFNFQSHSGATQLANCVDKPLASAEPRQLSYAPKPKLFNFQRWKKQRLLSSIYANLFSCSSVWFKLDYTVNH